LGHAGALGHEFVFFESTAISDGSFSKSSELHLGQAPFEVELLKRYSKTSEHRRHFILKIGIFLFFLLKFFFTVIN
jgi:hypothetical protein